MSDWFSSDEEEIEHGLDIIKFMREHKPISNQPMKIVQWIATSLKLPEDFVEQVYNTMEIELRIKKSFGQ